MRAILTAVALATAIIAVSPVVAVAQPKAEAAQPARPDFSWQDTLQHQTGEVVLPGPHVQLMLGKDYYFLGAADARRVLTEGWGNPPEASSDVLGLIIPSRFKPMDDGVWAAVVTYEDSGYVSDKDAAKIDADKLLTELRSGEEESNTARTQAGYPAIHLAGWAEAPSYDSGKHFVVWARDLQFGDDAQHTLNYDIRVLGRRGVLSLNVVAGMSDLAEVKAATGSIVQAAAFEPGSRYADFEKGKDKVAEYGVAGLVAAGLGAAVVKKLGLLGLIIAFGKKGLIFLIAGFGGLAAWVRRTFMGKEKPIVGGGPSSGGNDLVS